MRVVSPIHFSPAALKDQAGAPISTNEEAWWVLEHGHSGGRCFHGQGSCHLTTGSLL